MYICPAHIYMYVYRDVLGTYIYLYLQGPSPKLHHRGNQTTPQLAQTTPQQRPKLHHNITQTTPQHIGNLHHKNHPLITPRHKTTTQRICTTHNYTTGKYTSENYNSGNQTKIHELQFAWKNYKLQLRQKLQDANQ